MDCVVTFDGKKYSYPEFIGALNDGLLEELITDGSLPSELAFTSGKKRGFIESAQASDVVAEQPNAEEISAQMQVDPESWYEPQIIAEAKDSVENMSDVELSVKVGDLKNSFNESEQNVGVLAGIELINRLFAQGKADEARAVIRDLAKIGTAAGQLIRQFAELNKSNPDAFADTVEEILKGKNRTLTPKLKEKLKDLFSKQKEAYEKAQGATEKYAESRNAEDFIEMNDLIDELEIATDNLNKFMKGIMPKNIWDVLATRMQGNFLTIKSVLVNPAMNIAFTPVRYMKDMVAAGIDASWSWLGGVERTKLAPSVKRVPKGVVRGVKNAYKKAMGKTDPESMRRLDVQNSLSPYQAWKELFGMSEDMTPEDRKSVERKLANIVEGTALNANLMFRLLPFGDDFVYEPLRIGALEEIGKLKGLKGDALESFIISPDAESAELAKQRAKEGVFQEETIASRGVQWIAKQADRAAPEFPFLAGVSRFLIRANVPFVKTPAAYIKEVISYSVPIIPLAKAVIDGGRAAKYMKQISPERSAEANAISKKKAEEFRRSFADNIGKFTVGTTMILAATPFVINGFVTSSGDDEEDKKVKSFRYSAKGGPRVLNISAAKRFLESGGKDKSIHKDDEKVSLDRLGIFGAVIDVTNEAYQIKNDKVDKYDMQGKLIEKESRALKNNLSAFYMTLPSAVKNGINQSFTQGAGALFEAVANGEYDNYIAQLSKATSSTFLPNNLDMLSRANRDYMLDMRSKTLGGKFMNVINSKLGVFGKDKDIPLKRGLFGELINQTPKGSNPLAYGAVNILNKSSIFQDDIYHKLDMLYAESDGDNDLIPSIPSSDLKVKDKVIDLTENGYGNYNKYLQYVGEERKKLVEPILAKNTHYNEKLKKKITEAYEKGLEKGRKKFIKLHLK